MGKDYQIVLPKHINTASFENVLEKKYKDSTNTDNEKVFFNFQKVVWIEIFELSLIALWIKELIETGKKVRVGSAISDDINKYLFRYEFVSFLKKNNVENNFKTPWISYSFDLLNTPYFPLKFYAEEEFYELMRYLSDDRNYHELFEGLENKSIAKGPYLRNTIIRELGDNMFQHADGLSSNFIMSKFGKEVSDRTKWKKALVNNTFGNEKTFFQSLSGQEYITIVFSDKGPGIDAKLRDAWIQDEAVNREQGPTECQIIDYAFKEYTTSKPWEKRIEEFSELYDKELYDTEPPKLNATGLYRVFNTVKKNRGFIHIRSGKSFLSYNFLGRPENPSLYKSTQYKKLDNLANFGGTQIKIHVPLDIDRAKRLDIDKKTQLYQTKFQFPESTISTYFYMSIENYEVQQNFQIDHQKTEILRFFEDVRKLKLSQGKEGAGIVLDLCNQNNVSSKVLNFFIVKLMDSQNENFSHALINLSPEAVAILKTSFAFNDIYLPITVFDTTFTRHVIGISKEEDEIIEPMFSKSEFDKTELDLISNYKHLFKEEYGSVSIKHNRKKILELTIHAVGNYLTEKISDPSNGIYNPNIKVVMPSGTFCEGYFEFSKINKNSTVKEKLKQWLFCKLTLEKPAFILSIGKFCNKVLEEIYEANVNAGKKNKATLLNIKTPLKIDAKELFNVSKQLGKESQLFIFTDVIGTQKSVSNILSSLAHVEHISLNTVVSANPLIDSVEIGPRSLAFSSLIKTKINFFGERPSDWPTSDLVKVDENTNDLIRAKSKTNKPIWKRYNQDINFIDDLIVKEKNYLLGHYHDNTAHLPVLFFTPGLCRNFNQQIANVIINNFYETQTSDPLIPDNLFVCFLSSKKDLHKIASVISLQTYAKIWQIKNEEIERLDDFESNEFHGKTILFIDDAMDTGDNLLRIIDYCSRKKTASLLLYILIKRGSEYGVRKISSFKEYGNIKNIEFNYLAEIKIPTYKEGDCPLCKRKEEISKLKESLESFKHLKELNLLLAQIDLSLNKRPFSSVGENAKTLLHRVSGKQDFLSRLLIEEAKENIDSYEKIWSIVTEFEKERDQVLHLIYHIARERLFFLFDMKYGSENSGQQLKKTFVAICVKYLNDASSLSETELDSLLTLLKDLDEARFIDRIFALLKRTYNNEKLLNLLLMHICLLKNPSLYITNILATFSQFKSKILSGSEHAKLKESLQSVEKYLRSDKKHSFNITHFTANYSELRQIFHTLAQKKRSVVEILQRGNKFELAANEQVFTNLLVFLNKLTDLLHRFIEFKFYDGTIALKTEKLINKLQASGELLTVLLNELKRNANEALIISLQSTVFEIFDHLLVGNNSATNKKERLTLYDVIRLARTNLIDLIEYEFGLFENRLDNKILYQRPQTGEAVMAFGDFNGLDDIVNNILENIYTHSGATKLECLIRVHSEYGEIEICFLDDGNLKQNIQPDIGIETINSKLQLYSDQKYELRSISAKDRNLPKGYSTISRFYLTHIPNRNSL